MVLLSRAAALIGSGLALFQGSLAQSIPEFNDTEVGQISEPPRTNETLFESIFPGIKPKKETPEQPGQNSTNSTVTESIFPGMVPKEENPGQPAQNSTNSTVTESIFPDMEPEEETPGQPGQNSTNSTITEPIFPDMEPEEETPGQPGQNSTNSTITESIFPDMEPEEQTPGQPGQNSTNSTVTEAIFPGVNPKGDPPKDPPGQNLTNGTMTESIFPSLKNATKFPPPKPFIGIFRPSEDSWYRPPAGFSAAQPGDMLKHRRAPGFLSSVLKNLQYADQVLYRTCDTDLNPSWGLTTFLIPKEWDKTRPRVVSWQVPYETANFDFSPSYLLSTASPEIRYDLIDQMLANGWHVSIPDYQGPKSAFGAGKMAGYSVLDSLRAIRAIAYARYGLNPWTIRHVAWGYSGGALATAWAFMEKKTYVGDGHPRYVDTLHNKLRSWAIGGLPVKLLHTLDSVNNKAPAGFAINAISGMMQEFPLVKEVVEKYGKTEGEYNISVFDRVRTQSPRESMEEHTYANISNYFNGGFDKVVALLRKNRFHEKIKVSDPAPRYTHDLVDALMVYHGVYDSIMPISHVDDLLHDHWCNWVIQIDYVRNHDGGHEENSGNPNDSVLEWIARRFTSEYKLDDPTVNHQEMFPMVREKGCLVRDAAYNNPPWDFDAYMKGLNPVGESDRELA
ncbi:hypothetical protein MY11210_006677 [Beauveria gryllotalpidicola]